MTLVKCAKGKYSVSGDGWDSNGAGADCSPCDSGTTTPAVGTPGNKAAACSITFKKCVIGKYSTDGFDTDG